MSLINVFEYVFPVIGGCYKNNKDFIAKDIFGTCFSISNDVFLTAGHVLEGIEEEHLSVSIGKKVNKKFIHYSASKYEIFPNFDLAIIKVSSKMKDAKQFNWELEELALLDEIRTVGFPYALDFKSGRIDVRAFMGYVVNASGFGRLQASPRSYELSFISPKGLSGAPLFRSSKMFPPLKGYVIGNSHIKIPILNEEEVEKEGGKNITKIIESYEQSSFGIAIQVDSILNIESEILGNSIFDFIEANKLIQKRIIP